MNHSSLLHMILKTDIQEHNLPSQKFQQGITAMLSEELSVIAFRIFFPPDIFGLTFLAGRECINTLSLKQYSDSETSTNDYGVVRVDVKTMSKHS